MCACVCLYGERVHIWMCEHVRVCMFMCVAVNVCEQVAGIFEDDSRGLTHARPNKAAL